MQNLCLETGVRTCVNSSPCHRAHVNGWELITCRPSWLHMLALNCRGSRKTDVVFCLRRVISFLFVGEQAKHLFMMSGLPTPVLGQIWYVYDCLVLFTCVMNIYTVPVMFRWK